jgi:hypothetical protein
MLKLQPYEICKLRDVCFYFRDCKGLDKTRKSVFSCLYADEIKQEPELKSREVPVCSLSALNRTTSCS